MSQTVQAVLNNKRPSREQVREAILDVCANEYLTVEDIASILGREPQTIRGYLPGLVKNEQLRWKFSEETSSRKKTYKAI